MGFNWGLDVKNKNDPVLRSVASEFAQIIPIPLLISGIGIKRLAFYAILKSNCLWKNPVLI